jgi:hypothetical protein
MGTYSLWQADDQRYSLGRRVRRTEPNHSPEPPMDWTATDMERLEVLMEKAARQLAARAPRASTNLGTTYVPPLLPPSRDS